MSWCSMNNRVVWFHESLSKPGWSLFFGVFFIISQSILGLILSEIFPDVLILQTTFSVDQFMEIIHSWKAEQLNAYGLHFYFDFSHPVFYSIFLSSLLAFLMNRVGERLLSVDYFLLFIPFFAGLFDMFENILHLYLLANLNSFEPVFLYISSIFSWIKLALVGFSLLYICFLGTKLLKGKMNKK